MLTRLKLTKTWLLADISPSPSLWGMKHKKEVDEFYWFLECMEKDPNFKEWIEADGLSSDLEDVINLRNLK
jgi:hypothetical protein